MRHLILFRLHFASCDLQKRYIANAATAIPPTLHAHGRHHFRHRAPGKALNTPRKYAHKPAQYSFLPTEAPTSVPQRTFSLQDPVYQRNKGKLERFCKLLFIRHLKSTKIQGTYFKISALYFKIYGLYFLLHALCFFGTSGKGEKLSLYSYFIS